jgi:hypothetical protein
MNERKEHMTTKEYQGHLDALNVIALMDEKMLKDWHYDQIIEHGVDYLENRGQYDEEDKLVFPSTDSAEHRRAFYLANIKADLQEADDWAYSNEPIPLEGYYLSRGSKAQVVDACILAIAFVTFTMHPIPDVPQMRRVRKSLCEDARDERWNFATMDQCAEDMCMDFDIRWYETDEENEAYRKMVREWFSPEEDEDD